MVTEMKEMPSWCPYSGSNLSCRDGDCGECQKGIENEAVLRASPLLAPYLNISNERWGAKGLVERRRVGYEAYRKQYEELPEVKAWHQFLILILSM